MRHAQADRGQVAQPPRQDGIALGQRVHHAPRIAPQHDVRHRLGGEIICVQRIEAEQVPRHQELADLPAPVLHQLDRAHAATQDPEAGTCLLPLAVNFPIMLNRNGGAELLQQIERIARCRRLEGRRLEGLDRRLTAGAARAPLHDLCRALHFALHHSRVLHGVVYRGTTCREIRKRTYGMLRIPFETVPGGPDGGNTFGSRGR